VPYKDPEAAKAYDKAYREANKGRVAARYKTWREANKEREAATHKTWYDANKERKAVLWREWREANPDKIRARDARKRARKLHATPPWQSREELDAIWMGCPEGYHVDHIHPLKGKLSSGLNVPWNLSYLPAEENTSKGNTAPQPGYFDWFSEPWTVHAPPVGRVWTPTDYDNI
jgi:hypothetical protein